MSITTNILQFLLQPPCISALLVILFFYTLFHIFCSKRSSRLPPGSFGWCPFLGWTLSFIAPHVSSSRGQFLDYNIKRYGKIFRSHLFGHRTIVSCEAEFNAFVLQNEDRLFTTSYPKNIPGVLGDLTLLVVTGDVHKHLRGVALNLFAAMRTENNSFLPDIEDAAICVINSWRNKKTLVFTAETRKFTFSVIVKQILSLSPEDPETVQILDNYLLFMKGLVSVPMNLPGTPYAKAIQAKHRIKAILKTLWERRKKRESKVEGRLDFLDVLLAHKELSEAEILSLILDLLLGGYETTAMLIAILVKFLAHNPEMLSDLKEEHQSVKQNKSHGERLGWEDYKSMQFTQCLINEGLRLGNVVKFVHRKAITSIKYKEFEIPAGWKVLPVFSCVHLDSSLHHDPFRFDPERWQKVDVGTAKNFMPFGGGKRLCAGYELARIETSFFLHHLVLNYSWTLLDESDWPMSLPYLEFKNGLQIAIHPLNSPT